MGYRWSVRGEAGAGPTWVRGEARVHRGWVLLDETTVEPYAPLREPDLLREFVAIGSSRDVLHFAARFGLLRDGPGSDLREPISQWWEEIGLARGALEVQLDLTAARRGNARDIARLRDSWQASLPGSPAPVSDAELFAEARATVVAAVNRGLAGAQLEISMEPEPLRGYSLSPKLPDLLAFIYFALANVLVEESPLARCLECGGTFVVHDRRQRYCSERHASRARYRRFTDRNRLTTAS